MNIRKMTKEELELLSYNDIANLLLEEKKCQTTLDLFNEIGKMLGMTKKQIENKIGDFYTSLTTDQRFLLLEDGTWDLKSNHKVANKIIIEDDEDVDGSEQEEYQEDETTSDDLYTDSEEDTEDVSEEYKNLVIVDEEDLDSVE